MENRNQQNKQGQNQQNQQQNNKQQNQQENKAQNKRNKLDRKSPPRGGYISEASVFFCRGFLLLQLRTFYDRILLYKAHIKMKGMNFSGKEKFI